MIINKLYNFLKQFGLTQLLKRLCLKLISPVLSVRSELVLTIINHKHKENINEVKLMSVKKTNFWLKNRYISIEYFNKFNKFLENNSIGYYIEIDNELAAWGFVQTTGTYQYGQYFYEIPESIQILKNLYVMPNYRGMSLGKKINEVRINEMPDGCIPCVFVIPENKYAIRNLKMFGFEETLTVDHYNWFRSLTRTKIKVLKKNKLSDFLISGFHTK